MTAAGVNAFRIAVFAFACLVGVFATWMSVPQLSGRTAVEFPTDPRSAASAYAQRNAAVLAAKIGVVRGDLWAKAAFAYGAALFNSGQDASGADAPSLERTRALTGDALALAPHDSRLWLLLAASFLRAGQVNDEGSAALKMSYYTGANAVELVPARLSLGLQIQATQDSEFQDLVRHDIQIATLRKSELTPALIAAYQGASLSSRQFIEKSLAELDPGLLASVRSAAPNR